MRENAPRLMQEFSARTTDAFFVDFYDGGATPENLLNLLIKLDGRYFELLCHPVYVDEAFAKESVYNFQRERELKILTDPAIKQAIQKHGVELISFADL